MSAFEYLKLIHNFTSTVVKRLKCSYLRRVAQRPEKVLCSAFCLCVCVSVCLSAEPRLKARRIILRGEGHALYPWCCLAGIFSHSFIADLLKTVRVKEF